MAMAGTVGEFAERLESRRERWGFSYHVVQNESAFELAPWSPNWRAADQGPVVASHGGS